MHIKNIPPGSSLKSVIVVAGATGVGKTEVALELARHFKTEIISADSRQCFKELNIGVARPSSMELDTVPHHFIASHTLQEKVDAAVFEQYSLQKVAAIFEHHNTVIMAGGTGLYIKTFCEGIDPIPAVSEELRSLIKQRYLEKGLGWLQREVAEKDPDFYKSGEIQNPQRLMRALEIIESTGMSVLKFRTGNKTMRDFNIVKIGLELPKEELHRNINSRVDKMMNNGLVQEVEQLKQYRHLNALQTVGYTEIFDFLENKISLQEATELIKKNTRQYAKRQLTWFRKDKDIRWFSPRETAKIIAWLENVLPDH